MTSFTPAEIREFAKHGATIEKHDVVKARERPHIHEEVLAPAAQSALFGGMMAGGVSTLIVIRFGTAWSWNMIGAVVATAAIGAGLAGLIMAWYQLPVYRSMLTRWQKARIEPRQAEPDTRGRILTNHGDGRHTLSRCKAPHDWMRRLAQRVHDSAGNWTGGDMPARDPHFARIVTNWAAEYRDGNIQADLRDLGWLELQEGDWYWTDAARTELRAALYFESGGYDEYSR